MEEKKIKTEFVLIHKAGKLSFSSVEQAENYVQHFKEACPELDLSDTRLFKVDIYSLNKTF